MKMLSCKDMGGDDDFVAKGETAEEVKKVMMDHVMEMHPDKMTSMSEEEKKEIMMKADEMMKDM